MISPASIDDAPNAVALLRAAFEDRLNTVAGLRYRMSSARPADRLEYWAAKRGGRLVGWAYAGLDAFALGDTTGFAGIVVHPELRRQGIGSALWAVVSDHLSAIGAKRVVVQSDADPRAMGFVAARGFTLEATQTSLAVDPRTIVPPASLPPGVELRPTSCYADDPEPVYAADRETILDEPGPQDASGITYETWRLHHWDYPDCDHELSLVALVDGRIVGTTFLFSDRETARALNGGTGVARAFRGRGIGLLMKQRSLAAAAAAGIVRVITQNDESNAPMIAINSRLGYQPFSSGHSWVLER